MDRSRTREFQEFALMLEGCLRAYAEDLTTIHPFDVHGQAPPGMTPGWRGHTGVAFSELTPDFCRAGVRALPAPLHFDPAPTPVLRPDETILPGGLADSARILGRIEKRQRCEIQDLFARWLAAEHRRDTPETRRCFADNVARRILGAATDAMPGFSPMQIDPDEWRANQSNDEVIAFTTASGTVFSDAAPSSDRLGNFLLGARLCGHVEGLARFPSREIMARFSSKQEPGRNTYLAGEFGRAIATVALRHANLWICSTDAIVPGLHEHLQQMRLSIDPDVPPPAVAM